jgi:hypothetical protein
MITGIVGNRYDVNKSLLKYAVENSPSLFIDCANCANPHKLFPQFQYEQLNDVYVMEVELLYTFRDVLKLLPKTADRLGTKTIIITTFGGLFNYDDTAENDDVLEHAWSIIRKIGKDYNIIIGLKENRYGKYCSEVIPHGPHCLEPAHCS